MRRRIVRLTVIAAVLAVALFGLPSAAIVATYLTDDERSELGRAAEIGALRLSAELASGQGLRAVPALEPDITATLYDAGGHRVSGPGPATADAQVQLGFQGQIGTGDVAGDMVEAVPVTDDGELVGVLRVATPRAVVYPRIAAAWATMLVLGVAVVGAVWLIARRQAASLASPLEQLAGTAHRLGDGDFSARAPASDIPEIDAVSDTLNRTAGRIGDTFARERAFSADASHQLRTPLAGLRLGLETSLDPPGQDLEAAIRTAIDSTDRLEQTVDDLLALARETTPHPGPLPLHDVIAELRENWSGVLAAHGRRLRVDAEPGLPAAAGSAAAVRQVLSVLLDNSHRHGCGEVTLRVREATNSVAVDVIDEGHDIADVDRLFVRRAVGAAGHGIGLALARSLAEAEGGRLLLTSSDPVTFTLFLPLATDERCPAGGCPEGGPDE